jgi:hypothetical protein
MTVINKTLHVDDLGVSIVATVKDGATPYDVSIYPSITFLLKQPTGSVTTIAASYVNSGSDGAVYFNTASGHLDQDGDYKLQVHLHFNGTNEFYTDIFDFTVLPNL